MTKKTLRLACLVSVAFAVLACQKANIVEAVSEETDMTIDAGLGTTRTTNDGVSTNWAQGDAISAVHRKSSSGSYTADKFTYQSGTKFTGKGTGLKTNNDWYCFYPYSSSNKNPSQFAFTVAGTQVQNGNGSTDHLAGSDFPLFGKQLNVAKAANLLVPMNQVLSVAKFTVTNAHTQAIVVKSIEFTSTSKISGDFTGDFTKDEVAFTAKTNASKVATLNVIGGTSIAPGASEVFYLGVLPHEVPSGGVLNFKVTADVAGADVVCDIAKTYTNGTSFPASKRRAVALNFTAEEPQGEKYFVKVTSEPASWDGTYLVVDETNKKAFAYNVSDSYATGVTIADSKIAYTEALDNIAVRITDAGLDHPNTQMATDIGSGTLRAYNVKTKAGLYIYASSSEIQVKETNSKTSSGTTTTYYHAFNYNSGVYMLSSGNYEPGSSSSKYYYSLAYSDSQFAYGQQKSKLAKVQLYKLTEDPSGKQTQTLSFAQPSVTWTLGSTYKVGNSYAPQTVSGAQTTVTWTSSKDAVVKVVGGQLKIVGEGTATITATAEASEQYYSGSASYSLTVEAASTGSYYAKVTSEPASWDGTYLFVDENSSKAFAAFSDATNHAVSVTISNGKIVANETVNKYALTVTASGETHTVVGVPSYDVRNTDGNYIFFSQGDIKVQNTNILDKGSSYGNVKYNHCFDYLDNAVQVLSCGNYKNFTEYYLFYSSDEFNYSDEESHNIQLYKLVEDPSGKQTQTLSFAQPSVSWTLGSTYKVGSSYDPQTVSGAKTTVTWSSSKETVVKVVGSKLQIVGEGTATITATAAASEQYYSGSANYTLEIKAAASGDYYVKVTSEPTNWDGTYLFVDETNKKAFAAFSDVTNYAVSVTISEGKIAASETVNKYALTVTATGETHTNVGEPSYDVRNTDGNYVFYSDGKIKIQDTNILDKSSSSSSYGMVKYNHCFDYLDNAVQVLSSGNYNGFTKYYLKYSSSAFSYSSSESHKIQLYKLDGTGGKQYQTLSFASSSISWKLGDTYKVGSSYNFPQTVSGAKTSVTYTSGNTSVATIESNSKIKIVGTGDVVITATAAADDSYYSASASYTLKISQAGAYNLENTSLGGYLDEAESKYTDTNYSSVSVIGTWANPSSTNRQDFPAPISLSWTTVATGTKTVSIYNDAAMTDLEMSTTSTSTSADIYNLEVNATYYYKVTSGTTTLSSGSFSTEGRRRMMKVSTSYYKGHANNCRDLGGLKTVDNKTIKCGKIFRGSNMDATTSAEKEYILGYMNVGLDVDLRSGSSSSVSDDNGNSSAYQPFGSTIAYVKGGYSGSISDFKVGSENGNFKTIFTKILSTLNSGKACYIHCYVGADRTGYVCMLLEAVLGVSPKDCSMDFELTSFSVVGSRTRTGGGTTIGKDGLNYISGYSTGSTFKEKAYNILLGYGVTDAQITEFRNLMLQ